MRVNKSISFSYLTNNYKQRGGKGTKNMTAGEKATDWTYKHTNNEQGKKGSKVKKNSKIKGNIAERKAIRAMGRRRREKGR